MRRGNIDEDERQQIQRDLEAQRETESRASKPHSRDEVLRLARIISGDKTVDGNGQWSAFDAVKVAGEFISCFEQLEVAQAMCRDILKRNPPSAFIDTWATVNKAQEFLDSFPATRLGEERDPGRILSGGRKASGQDTDPASRSDDE